MPTHRIEFTATTVPADLPKDAKVTQVSKYPVVIERGGNTLELLAIPTKTATNKAKLAATIKIDGKHVELTEDTARTLARELFTLANDRQHAREKAEREERRNAELAAARLRAELFGLRTYGDRYGYASNRFPYIR